MTADVVLVDIAHGIGTVTLNRPRARNALDTATLRALPRAMAELDATGEVDVIVLTGTDPAFCAGLDLKELGSTGGNLAAIGDPAGATGEPGQARRPERTFWRRVGKPVIGAINGPAVTGGLELALQCDFLVASDRARFGDTHARVGVMPGGGMSVLLAQAVGWPKAKQLSLSGRFLDAAEALQWGLVTDVVAHDDLLAFTRALAADIAANDRAVVRRLLEVYRHNSMVTGAQGWDHETANFAEFRRSSFDPAAVERRRASVVERGRQL